MGSHDQSHTLALAVLKTTMASTAESCAANTQADKQASICPPYALLQLALHSLTRKPRKRIQELFCASEIDSAASIRIA